MVREQSCPGPQSSLSPFPLELGRIRRGGGWVWVAIFFYALAVTAAVFFFRPELVAARASFDWGVFVAGVLAGGGIGWVLSGVVRNRPGLELHLDALVVVDDANGRPARLLVDAHVTNDSPQPLMISDTGVGLEPVSGQRILLDCRQHAPTDTILLGPERPITGNGHFSVRTRFPVQPGESFNSFFDCSLGGITPSAVDAPGTIVVATLRDSRGQIVQAEARFGATYTRDDQGRYRRVW